MGVEDRDSTWIAEFSAVAQKLTSFLVTKFFFQIVTYDVILSDFFLFDFEIIIVIILSCS